MPITINAEDEEDILYRVRTSLNDNRQRRPRSLSKE